MDSRNIECALEKELSYVFRYLLLPLCEYSQSVHM